MLTTTCSSYAVFRAQRIDNLLSAPRRALMPAMKRPQKITFGEMRESGVRRVLIFCSDYKCSHSMVMDADMWADTLRLSDIEDGFVCKACGKRGADVRPNFPSARMGH